MINHPVQRVFLATPIVLFVVVCLGSASCGSAGPVWVYGHRTDQAYARAERDSITAWLACLERVARQIGGRSPLRVAPHVATHLWKAASRPAVCFHRAVNPVTQPVLPQMTNLPPPGVHRA